MAAPGDAKERERARAALIGGVYSNHVALAEVLADARRRGIEECYCLGDLGAFGPHPDRVFPILLDYRVRVVQGNYDHSIGNRRDDCACGYTDPRDNHFARLSYRYTFDRTSDRWKDWLRDLPVRLDFSLGGKRVHLCHGSPRRTNEFLWESTTPDPFLRKLFAATGADVIACTHTGLHWQRELEDKLFVNAGVIGRPENDGTTEVGYTIIEAAPERAAGVRAEHVRVAYDHARLAAEMREENLPAEFIATIETGWWTSCLEILPGKERARGRF
ncbi:MAG: metallophosphatase family protein [Planctomycetes bacterium]|nr:metallophosphatase family protein [Planctomycetota bacterium]